jgi:Putative Actinobacterial Holin-X, holin superfamily III
MPMTEKQPHHANGASETLQDWPTLVGRAVDDVTHILQSEAHMLETNMSAALETRLASAIATLTVVAVMVCGGVCILSAAILLLHEWLPLWQAFGLAGVGIMLVGIAIYATTKSAPGFNSTPPK